MDLFDRVLELSRYGYFCGQILAILTSTAAWAFPRTAAAA